MKKIFYFLCLFVLLFIKNVNALDIYSENMVIYNLNDDTIINEKNKDEITSIASMTKIMTVLVAIENIEDINETIILTKDVFYGLKEANASVAGFKVGQKVTYKDLLYGAFLPSGADATNALALNISGSIDGFVKLMNNKVKELNLKNTNFVNTTGLDEDNHYSTVNDVAIILKEALKNDVFKVIFTSKKYLISDKTLSFSSTLDKSLSAYSISADYILGGKTGYTLDAGRCLASIAYDKDEDIYYLLVTSKAPIENNYYHLLDAKNIYDYHFDNYGYIEIINELDIIDTIKTKYAKEKTYDIKLDKSFTKYMLKDFDKNKLEVIYEGINLINYDILDGTEIGKVIIKYDNNEIDKINILFKGKLHFSIFEFIKSNIVIILISIFTLSALIISLKNTRKRKK